MRARAAGWGGLPAWTGVGLGLAAVPMVLRPAHFLIDDAYFYLVIAQHVVAGDGSTFNGITPTNGYHPLWLSLCVPLVAAAGSGVAVLRTLLLAQLALTVGTAWALLRAVRLAGVTDGRQSALLMLPVLGLYFFGWGTAGSEAHLNGLCLSLSVVALLRAQARGDAPAWVLAGALLGLSFLARLDDVFVIASLSAWAAWGQRTQRPRRLAAWALAFGLPMGLVVAPYLAWNVTTFGHLVPVSGAIKSSFPTADPTLGALSKLGWLGVVGAAAAVAVSASRWTPPRARGLLRALAAGVVGQAAYLVLFARSASMWPWYYVPSVLTLALTLATAAHAARAERAAHALVLGVAVGGTALALGLCWATLALPGSMHGTFPTRLTGPSARVPPTAMLVGTWLGTHAPPRARVLAYDFPGMLAFYSGRAVFPLDGLAADFAYSEAVERQGPEVYFAGGGVTHVYAPAPRRGRVGILWGGWAERVPGGHALSFPAPLSRTIIGPLRLSDRDIVLRVPHRPDVVADVAVWSVRPLRP